MSRLRAWLELALTPKTPAQARALDRALLAFVLLIALLRGLTWACVYPALKISDEPAHFDNVQYRAEHSFHAPRPDGTHIEKVMTPTAAPELMVLWKASNHYWRGRFLRYKRQVPDEIELEHLASVKSNHLTTGQSSSLSYPGVYYGLAVPFYRAFRSTSVLKRLYAVRVYSILWGLLLVGCTFVAARWTLDSRAFAVLAALFMSLQPMAAQQTTGVNNDAGVFALGALMFVLQLAILRRLPRPPSIAVAVGLALATALALGTKPHAFALVPGTIVLGCAAVWCAPRSRATWLPIGIGIVVFLAAQGLCHLAFERPLAEVANVVAAPAAVTALPAPPAETSTSFLAFLDGLDDTFADYLVTSAWGMFCWLDFSLSGEWFVVLRWCGRLFWLGLAVAAGLWMLRPELRTFWNRRLGAFAALTAVTGFFTILYAEYLLHVPGDSHHVIQGRAFLIAGPAFAITGAIALGSLVPRRFRPLAAFLGMLMLVTLSFGALLTVAGFQYVE